MNTTKAYYSIVQYCPDLSRSETVNIGVVLLVPDRGYLKARLTRDNSRVRHVFGVAGDQLKQLTRFKESFTQRIDAESVRITSLEALESFINTRGNFLQLTPPRFVKTRQCDEQLEELYSELVGAENKKEPRKTLVKELQERFANAGVGQYLKSDIHLPLPQTRSELRVPFAFQNGDFNLLQAVPFEAEDSAASFRKACVHSMQGLFVKEAQNKEFGPMRLNVIGRFRSKSDEAIPIVRTTLGENSVRLFTEDELHDLVDLIKRTGKPIRS